MKQEVWHNKFRIWTCIILVFFSIQFASASNLYIEIVQGEITSIIPFRYNEYYRERFYFGVGQGTQSSQLVQENRIILNLETGVDYVFILEGIDFSQNYILEINGEQRVVSFCNNDGSCEPCFEGFCENIENFLTCPNDCPSGSRDNYCDLQRDGICDPDCPNYDFDCEECIDNICVYEGIDIQRTFCSELGGTHCPLSKVCSGHLTYADDTGTFCCIGNCFERSLTSEQRAQIESAEQEVSSSSMGRDSTLQEDRQTIALIVVLAIFLVVATIVVVVSESKKIAEEHKIRKYVYDLVKSGYSIPQVESTLLQQNIEKPTIDRILRKYKR